MNIAAILSERAATHPDVPAIIDAPRGRAAQARTTTYAGLERAAAQGATLLWGAGLRPGDRVLVFVPMSAELYAVLIALFRLGLVPMFVDPSSGLEHLERCCKLMPPRAFVGSPKAHLLRALSPALRRIPLRIVVGGVAPGALRWSHARQLAPWAPIHASGDDDPALISFTSGSTGAPKVCVRSHRLLLAQQAVLARHFGGDVVVGTRALTALPIFVLAYLAGGATSVIPPGDLRHPARINPVAVVAALEAHQPTRAGASPAFWERIVAHCQATGQTLPALSHIYLGGAPVFPHLLRALHAVAPAAITVIYGSTEAEPIAHVDYAAIQPADFAAMTGGFGLLAGTPVPEIEVAVLANRWGAPLGPLSAAAFAALRLGADQPGEIVVRGDHVLPGYLHGEGDAETKLRVAGAIWHRTGDAGYLDARGRLWLLGRCAAGIADARGVLYPLSVECAVSSVPEVRRVALVGAGGRRTLVYERRQPGDPATPAGLLRHTAWAAIDDYREVPRIPVDRRHNAKVDYPALGRLLARE
ncbi:MAG TPA: AMP-binding protein [Ktedonobacterales bacterium]|jgi:acyl-CoA synthetase (AMP-forming)/AMP-acid ligase II